MTNDLVRHIQEIFNQEGILPDHTLYLGVSGGMDSMVLLHSLKEFSNPIKVTHVNFRLRGEESEMDSQFVEDVCINWGVEFLLHNVKEENIPITQNSNIQLQARQIRYTWWRRLLAEHPQAWVVTAHHLNDAFESTILNIARGTGVIGVIGIRQRNERFIRPMINVPQKLIKEYQTKNNIPYRSDSSNDTDKYTRNKVRHHIIPEITDHIPSALEGYHSTHSRIEEELKLWNHLYQEWCEKFVDESGKDKIRMVLDSPYVVFGAKYLESLDIPFPLALQFLKTNFSTRDGVLQYAGLTVRRSKDGFEVQKVKESENIFQINEPGQYHFGIRRLVVSKVHLEEIIVNDPDMIHLPADKINWPLVFRNFESGDRIRPFGMNGQSKKLQDIFTDSKLTSAEKVNIKVLANREEVLWIHGMVKSELSRISNDNEFWFRFQLMAE